MKWCCSAFEGWYSQAGHRGVGMLAGKSSEGDPEFFIQFRAIEDGEELTVGLPNAILIQTQLGIRYCPWCGRELEQWYRDYLSELDRPELKT